MAGEMQAEALWFVGPCAPELRRESVPPPGKGEIRLRAVASGISHGTEMLVYRGQVPAGTSLDLPTLAGSFDFPVKYGYALVGRVIDVGEEVGDWKPGDLAFALHPHQSIALVPAGLATRLPPALDPATGVFTANLETAVNVMLDAPFKLGERVAVFGLGTVGLLVAQLFKRAGAGLVVGIDPLARRREAALRVGVDQALETGDDLPGSLAALTAGRGLDIAVEASGSTSALQPAIDSVADEGTVMVVSWYGAKPVSLQLGGHFHRGRVRILSSQVGRMNPSLAPRWDRVRRAELVRQLLTELPLGELISHRVPFREAASAYRLVDESPGEVLQVVLIYDEEKGGQG